MNIKVNLERRSQEEYGDNYRPHLLEQYKLYVEMADRVSQRRATANSFFLTLNTGLLGSATGLAGFLFDVTQVLAVSWGIAIFGLGFSYVWWRILKSYRQLNTAKFMVVHDLESKLPVAPYDDEWEKVERGKNPKLYLPLTVVEARVPMLFMLGYSILAIVAGVFFVLSLLPDS